MCNSGQSYAVISDFCAHNSVSKFMHIPADDHGTFWILLHCSSWNSDVGLLPQSIMTEFQSGDQRRN